MSNPLAPFLNRVPTGDELAALSTTELTRIVDAAKTAELLDVDDLRETKKWARDVRSAAERALESRK